MEAQVAARLAEMWSVTPSGAGSLMSAFASVCRLYYDRGEEFKQALFDAYIGQMFDQFMTDFDARDRYRLPELQGAKPAYYEDIEAVFKGEDGSRYPFAGMLNISLSDFRAAYKYTMVGGSAGPESGTGYWENGYLERWTMAITQAMFDEQAILEAIKYYTLRRYQPWSPWLINEDLGWRRQKWGNRAEQLRRQMYEEKNWAWVYSAFEMEDEEPEILKELRDEDAD